MSNLHQAPYSYLTPTIIPEILIKNGKAEDGGKAGVSREHYFQPPYTYSDQDRSERESVDQSESTKASICCCKRKTCTKVIAAIQIILSVAFLMVAFYIVLEEEQAEELRKIRDEVEKQSLSHGNFTVYVNFHPPSTLFFIAPLLLGIINLVLGWVLFAGAHYENPDLLLLWMIPTGIEIGIFSLLVFYYFILMLMGYGLYPFQALLPLLVILLSIFKVVSKHRGELVHWPKEGREPEEGQGQTYINPGSNN